MGATVLVVGSLGSIGSRYMLALKGLGVKAVGWDINDVHGSLSPPDGAITHAIVAVPTASHYDTV